MFRLLLLDNGWADCVEIWHAIESHLVEAHALLQCPCNGRGWGISARAHVHTALLYLGNDLADCVQIWCVGRGSLTTCFPQVIGWVPLHVHTCTPHLLILGAD